jgi:hypothetical protein
MEVWDGVVQGMGGRDAREVVEIHQIFRED